MPGRSTQSLERMQNYRELPSSFKLIRTAVIFATVVTVLVLGGMAVGIIPIDHTTMALFFVPIFAIGACGILCMFQLPSAMAAWAQDPQLRSAGTATILVVGWILAVAPFVGIAAVTWR